MLVRLAVLALLAAPSAAQIVFAPPQPHPVSHPLLATLAGDLDFDGDADVVAEGANPGPFQATSMSVLLSGQAGLGAPSVYTLSISPVGEGQIADVADFDGPTLSVPDGIPDVVLGGVGFGNAIGIGWKAGHGDGSFVGGFNGLQGFNLAGSAITDVIAIDLEGDGDLDLVGLEGGVPIFLPAKITTITFGTAATMQTTLPAVTAASFIAAHDLDADGRVDVVCNSLAGGTISIFRGSPAGLLAPVTVPVGGSPREPVFTDLDGNGAADLLLANQGLNAVQVLLANGLGSLHPATAFPAGVQPTRLATGDFDGDGATDALVSAANGEIVAMQGHGDGTLTRVATVSSSLGALGLSLADLDGDGDLDATVARGGAAGVVDVLPNADYPAASPFEDLGHALAGTKGYPIQLAAGTLLPGEPFAFDLLNARPVAPAVHVVGLSPLFAPYKGGTLVPAPDVLNVLATDAAGSLHLAGPWPAGGSGLTLWLQFWITDPAGPKGRAASNAVSATIP